MAEPPGQLPVCGYRGWPGSYPVSGYLWGLRSSLRLGTVKAATGDQNLWKGGVLSGWKMGQSWLWHTGTQPNLASDSPAPLPSMSPSRRVSPSQQQRPQQWTPQLPDFMEKLTKLKNLVVQIGTKALCMSRHLSTTAPTAQVTCMFVCGTDDFRPCVFLLQIGAFVPLHDPRTCTWSSGCSMAPCTSAAWNSWRQGPAGDPVQEQGFQFLLQAGEGGPVSTSPALAGQYREDRDPCPCSNRWTWWTVSYFLDVLAPPYHPAHLQECHFYRVLGPPQTQGGLWLGQWPAQTAVTAGVPQGWWPGARKSTIQGLGNSLKLFAPERSGPRSWPALIRAWLPLTHHRGVPFLASAAASIQKTEYVKPSLTCFYHVLLFMFSQIELNS
jgi:hypothetical protein